MARVLITYKPARPTRSLELGKHPETGKPRRVMFRAATTRIVDEVEAAAIQAAAKGAGILADFAFQALEASPLAPVAKAVEAAVELAAGEDLGDAVEGAVAKALDPDGDGKLGKAKGKAGKAGKD